MIVQELVVEALRNLGRHKLRSLLTALGIVFGVASVMAMVATGEGARRRILAQIEELGIRNVIVNAKKPPAEEDSKKKQGGTPEYGLTFRDADQIEKTLPMVDRVLRVHDVEKWIWFKSRRLQAKVRGVGAEYMRALRLAPFLGRALDAEDDNVRRRVCVVRERLIREAKYVGDPLALDLKIGSEFYRVVGVLRDFEAQSQTQTVLGIDGRAFEVYVPFRTVVDRYGLVSVTAEEGNYSTARVELHQLLCIARTEDDVELLARGIQAVLGSFHKRKDYEVTVPLELLQSRQETQRVFDVVLPIIAGISLLVGGIGILNIMLASVTERTREIGIRRAIGATRGDIVMQFLVETVSLSAAGGLIGVAGGVAFVVLLEHFAQWNPTITSWSVVLSLSISCATGVVFGIYPARRAAMLDPIRALRHE
ncbi:MAG: ABC transporter permease [Planctomycetota bacterium]